MQKPTPLPTHVLPTVDFLQAVNLLPTVVLSANQVRLEPLTLQHEAGLRQAVQDGELWKMLVTTAPAPEDVAHYIQAAANTRMAFAVIDETTGDVVGTTAFYQPDAAIRRVFIGYTWYRQSAWRTRINTACKYLLLAHAFETLGCRVVNWETDALNTRSQAALERLGAKKDGVLRCHKIRKDGTVRDTVVYSMLREEWAGVKAALAQKLGLLGSLKIPLTPKRSTQNVVPKPKSRANHPPNQTRFNRRATSARLAAGAFAAGFER